MPIRDNAGRNRRADRRSRANCADSDSNPLKSRSGSPRRSTTSKPISADAITPAALARRGRSCAASLRPLYETISRPHAPSQFIAKARITGGVTPASRNRKNPSPRYCTFPADSTTTAPSLALSAKVTGQAHAYRCAETRNPNIENPKTNPKPK